MNKFSPATTVCKCTLNTVSTRYCRSLSQSTRVICFCVNDSLKKLWNRPEQIRWRCTDLLQTVNEIFSNTCSRELFPLTPLIRSTNLTSSSYEQHPTRANEKLTNRTISIITLLYIEDYSILENRKLNLPKNGNGKNLVFYVGQKFRYSRPGK